MNEWRDYGQKQPANKKEGRDVKYLEMHQWNVKRMKMQSMWGWFLPMEDNQRAVGSSLNVG